MKTLIYFLFRWFPVESSAIIFFSLAAVAFEGVGFALLLPILEMLGTSQQAGADHPVSSALVGAFDLVGVRPTVLVLLLTGIALFAVQAMVKYLQVAFTADATAKAEMKFRRDAFGSLLNAQVSYFHQRRLGDMSNAIVKEAERAAATFIFLTRGFIFASLVIVYLSIAAALSWPLALLAAVLGAVLMMVFSRRKGLGRIGEAVKVANENLEVATVENISGIRDVKAFGLQSVVAETFQKQSTQASAKTRTLRLVLARRTFLYEVSALMLVFALVAIGIQFLEIEPALIVAFLAIFVRIRSAMISGLSAWDGLASGLPGLFAVEELRRSSTESADRLPSGDKPAPDDIDIHLHDVSFSYADDGPAVRNMTLHIPANKVTAIVGMSGAGKSTLVDIVARFFDPTDGRVAVNGIDLREINLAEWHAKIGFVSQETFLFNDTIERNIAFGDLSATAEAIQAAAALAHADGFIRAMPNGYQTIVGDRGVRLSGGQRQRIAIARAALRDPQLLILDEATSGLDSKSELAIQNSISDLSRGRTVVVIAHRLSTIRRADQIVVLQDGMVVEIGDHAELLEADSHYAEFHHLQIG
jgi:subfamily B ATP-binding cassette protein MsbA